MDIWILSFSPSNVLKFENLKNYRQTHKMLFANVIESIFRQIAHTLTKKESHLTPMESTEFIFVQNIEFHYF